MNANERFDSRAIIESTKSSLHHGLKIVRPGGFTSTMTVEKAVRSFLCNNPSSRIKSICRSL